MAFRELLLDVGRGPVKCTAYRGGVREYCSSDEKPKNTGFEVVKDAVPVEDGGFRPGARFSFYEMHEMLALGYFSQGTVIRDARTNKRYSVICGGKEGDGGELRSHKKGALSASGYLQEM